MNNKRRVLGAVAGLMASVVSVGFLGSAHTQTGYQPPVAVETESFGEDSFALGTLSSETGALSRDLWRGASVNSVDYLFDHIPVRFEQPAMLGVMKRAMLSPGDAPTGSTDSLTGKKLMLLAEAGFYEDASSIAELARGLSGQPELSQAIAFAELMRGDVVAACRRNANLNKGRNLPFWLKLRLLCYATTGENAAADLTLGLLRERKLLSPAEDRLLGALVSGIDLKADIRPVTGFEYAALRQLQFGIDLGALDHANGAVLRALATEIKAPQQARVFAGEQAMRRGVMSVGELQSLFRSFTFAPERLAEAKALMIQNRKNYLIDPLVYQAAAEMTAPEFALDRQSLIGEALRGAGGETRFIALAKLYAPMLQSADVVVNYAPYAREYALAGIVAGDMDLATRWIDALAAGTVTPATSDDVARLIKLLTIKNAPTAKSLAARLGLMVPDVNRAALANIGAGTRGDKQQLARILNLGFEAATEKRTGQGALVALAATGLDIGPDFDNVRKVIVLQTLYASELGSSVAELAFDRVLSDEFPQLIRLASVDQQVTVAAAGETSSTAPRKINGMPVPRVKPKN